MYRRLLAGVAALSGVGALAAMPVVAQATERHWYKGSSEITKGAAHTIVATKGPFTVTFFTGPWTGSVVECKAKDSEEIWNPSPSGDGEDKVTGLEFAKCKATPSFCTPAKTLYVVPHGLPWHSVLFYKFPKEGDEVEGVELEVGCKGGAHVLLEGSLAGPVNPGVAELDEVLENSAKTVEAEVQLFDHLKAGPGKIKIGP